MKKQFIIACGVGWCGTTSLYRTLVENKILHGGFAKESYLLNNICLNQTEHNKDEYENSAEYKSLIANIDEGRSVVNGGKYTRSIVSSFYNTNDFLNVLQQFDKEEYDNIFSLPFTKEKYLKYYQLLSEYSNSTYQYIGDYTNINITTLLHYPSIMQDIIQDLKQDYDVKFLLILRDPIRAFFSAVNYWMYVSKLPYLTNKYKSVVDYMKEVCNPFLNYEININYDYCKLIKNLKENYQELSHYVIMENFFDDQKNDQEVLKLENFLSAKIKTIHPCVFVPDKGINPPKTGKYATLLDQWISDREVLSPELYAFMKKKFQPVYNEFEEMHGCLPSNWGYPIDYGYNAL